MSENPTREDTMVEPPELPPLDTGESPQELPPGFHIDLTDPPRITTPLGLDMQFGDLAGMTRRNSIPVRGYEVTSAPPGYSNVRNGPDIAIAGTEVTVREMIDPSPDPEPPPEAYLRDPPQTVVVPLTVEPDLEHSYDSARKKASLDHNEISGCCFPECSNSDLTAQLDRLIPKLHITKWNTDTFPALFQRFIHGIDSLSTNSFSSGDESGIENSTLDNVYSKLIGSSASNGYPKSISLLFESLPCTYDCKIALPITSTPLSINSQLDTGWKTNQSIFEFIKKQIGGNSPLSELIGSLFGDFGKSILNIANVGTTITENLMHIFGSDIQLGPYWSLGEGALDNRQTLTFNTILVNDSYDHFINNSKVVKKLFINSLPLATGGFRIRPPSVFDIELDTCVAGMKKYFLCTGQFSCEAKGRYYKNKIPEAYSLSLTFNSLIPDLLAIQLKK